MIEQFCYPRLSTTKVESPKAFINSGIVMMSFFE